MCVQSYIDFEIAEGERERTRALYERLLDRTRHVKVWMSYAAFEAAPMPLPEDDDEDDAAARQQAAQAGAESPASRDVHARAYGPVLWPALAMPRFMWQDHLVQVALFLRASLERVYSGLDTQVSHRPLLAGMM